MKARRAILVAPGKFEIVETDVYPKKDQVMVKVTACGLCNWELNHWKGYLGNCPLTLGHEFGGIVVALGEDVDNFKVGDLVTGLGEDLTGFSDYALFNKNRCYKLNPGYNPLHVLGEPLKCVITVLRGAAPEAGDVGVVQGCGPMGLWSIQGLAGNSLSALIALDIDDEKLKLAAKFGATHVINPKKQNAEQMIREISNGHMADFVIEGTGIPGLFNQGMHFLRSGRGRLILMSSHETAASGFDFRPAIDRSLEIRVTHPTYSFNQDEDMRRAALFMNKGVFKLDDIISHSFRLEDIEKAFETLENKPEGYLKGIVVP